MKTVPRIGRILDLAGLLLFLVGSSVFVWSWVGFRGVPDYVPPPDAGPWAALAVAEGYGQVLKVGAGLILTGIAVFVLAWWVAREATRRA